MREVRLSELKKRGVTVAFIKEHTPFKLIADGEVVAVVLAPEEYERLKAKTGPEGQARGNRPGDDAPPGGKPTAFLG